MQAFRRQRTDGLHQSESPAIFRVTIRFPQPCTPWAITSNIQTGAARGHAEHQLATLVAAGVRVALCTDNPAVSDTRLNREYEIATI
jgi:adenosine deaminase